MRTLAPLTLALSLVGGAAFAAPLVFTDAGATAADIQDTVDDFRARFSGLNPFTPTNEDPDGRREINWDAVPDAFADPGEFPGDFFNGSTPGRARGIAFAPTGDTTGFEVSSSTASGVPILFDEPDEYTFFSPERLFRPKDGLTFDILFFDPLDQTSPAAVKGFGAVFTGLELFEQAVLSFFGADGTLLDKLAVPPSGAAKLSFAGLVFDEAVIAKVSVGTGLSEKLALELDEPVMDDFLFGEPIRIDAPEVPLPAGVVLWLSAIGGFAALGRRRKPDAA